MRWFVVAALAACGSSSSKPPIKIIDAPPADAAPPMGPNLVQVEVFGGIPSLVSYRDGGGPWQVPTLDGMGFYDLYVTNDFEVVLVCADQTGFESSVFRMTATEVGRFFAPCLKNDPLPATVAVTGQMTQPGTIFMYDTASSTTGPWNFSLKAPVGTHDVVAFDTTNILIRRNVSITGAMSIATVDLSAGSPLATRQFTVNGRVSGDTLASEVDLFLTNDFAFLTGTSTAVQVPPSSLLQTNDFEFIHFDVSTSTTRRYVDTELTTTTPATFDLMPVLSGITYAQPSGVLAASWGTLPSNVAITMDLTATPSTTVANFQQVYATAGWIAATSTTQLAFDVMPPGYDPSWTIDLAGPYVRTFNAFAGTNGVSYGTSLSEGVNGAVPRLVAQTSDSASAIAPGMAWTKRILRDAVAAPNRPAITTQMRKKIRAAWSGTTSDQTRPPARKPL